MSESEKRLGLFSRFAQAVNTATRLQTESFALNILPTGSGGGQISRNPELDRYQKGQVVALTAVPNADSKFVGWSGDATGSYNVCNLRMDDAKSVIASFESLGDRRPNTLPAKPALEKRIGDLNEFIDHGDGTVTDTRSGLMWMRPAVGQNWSNGTCAGVAKLFGLSEASQFQSDFSGHHDWRLPTIEELKGLIFANRVPALDEVAFPMQSGRYFWTSSRNTADARREFQQRTMIIALRSGVVGYTKEQADQEHLRLVRKSNPSQSMPRTLDERSASNPKRELIPANLKFQFLGGATRVTSKSEIAGTVTLGEEATKQLGHFLDHEDGTATDTLTGLMWMRAAIGLSWNGYTCVGHPTRFTLTFARKIISGIAEHRDWRLPSVAELSSLIGQEFDENFYDLVFPKQSRDDYFFWTHSGQKINPSLKRRAASSDIHTTNPLAFVRLVRSDNQLAITTNTTGSGNGKIVRSLFSDNYPFGAELTLTAQADADSSFIGWQGDLSGQNVQCNVTMDSSKSIIAEFAKLIFFDLVVQSTGAGSGIVSRNPKEEKYVQGSVVVLTARPVKGSKFVGWHGDLEHSSATCTILLDGTKSITAEFAQLDKYELTVQTIGTGNGTIERSLDAENYLEGTQVTLTARAEAGSKFICWHGDVEQSGMTCMVRMNATKAVSVEFEEIKRYSLTVQTIGTGIGTIERSLDAEGYLAGTQVTLTASAKDGSKFKRWLGHTTARGTTCKITMDMEKAVSAEFEELEAFLLNCTRNGNGDGSVNWELQSGQAIETPQGTRYVIDSVITLAAMAEEGSRFKRWHGDAKGASKNLSLTFDSAKSVVAEFVALDVFTLSIEAKGDGEGVIICNPDSDHYFDGTTVTLTAVAQAGSVFSGWHGDAKGLEDSCSVSMKSPKSVIGQFEKVVISKPGIDVEFVSATHSTMKEGQSAIIFYLFIRNTGEKQVRVTIPSATYLNRTGEEVQQSVWLSGLLIGSEGATIRAGTFRKVGLVFYKSTLNALALGERLYLTVDQSKPAMLMSYTFRCKDAGTGDFELIKVTSENQEEIADAKQLRKEMAALRWEFSKLELKLATTQLQLTIAHKQIEISGNGLSDANLNEENPLTRYGTLKTVVNWLAAQDRVLVTALRAQLLPLDLLPNSVIDELNEMALDLTGAMALEEVGDEIVVSREILDEVLLRRDWNQT